MAVGAAGVVRALGAAGVVGALGAAEVVGAAALVGCCVQYVHRTLICSTYQIVKDELVQISEQFDFEIDIRKCVNVKGKGAMDMYTLK